MNLFLTDGRTDVLSRVTLDSFRRHAQGEKPSNFEGNGSAVRRAGFGLAVRVNQVAPGEHYSRLQVAAGRRTEGRGTRYHRMEKNTSVPGLRESRVWPLCARYSRNFSTDLS